MNQYVSVEQINKDDLNKNSRHLKEEIKMSLLNMAMNIGHFNINISIKKDEEKKREAMRRRIEHDQRIKELLENRDNILNNYYMNDYMR